MAKSDRIEKKNSVSNRVSGRPWLLAGGLLVAMLVVYILYNVYIQDMVSLAALANAKDRLGVFVQDYAIFVFVAAILAYALVTSILLPVVVWLSLLISYSFAAAYGVWVGALVASLSIYLGVLAGLPLAFLAVRYIVGDRLRRRFGPSIDRFAKGVERDALFYIMALRLIPVVPYILVNAAPALVRVKLSTHMLGSAIGLVPGIFVYAYLGASLTTAVDATSIQVSWQILVAFAGLGLLSLTPILIRRLAPQFMETQHEARTSGTL